MTDRSDIKPGIAILGTNPVKLWGISTAERTRRIAMAAGLEWQAETPRAPCVIVNAAAAFDPSWLRHIVTKPGTALTLGGVPVIVYAATAEQAQAVSAAMLNGNGLQSEGLEPVAFETGPTIENRQLRKRETPFLEWLRPETVSTIERASYKGAYKGVTDLLTKYLWPEWALVLTRIAARVGMTPNMVTAIGATLCVAATFAFAGGHYWLGMAMGLVFMVLDTVDGKLARCTITSSWWGNIFDHGIDIVHPPFWWYAWGLGLSAWGLALSERAFALVMAAILIGYVVQRLIEGYFIRRFGRHIHVWQKVDSDFRLITARRNPNMVILFISVIARRPDLGLIAIAWWTVLSLIFHAVRLAQAEYLQSKGMPIRSWLSDMP